MQASSPRSSGPRRGPKDWGSRVNLVPISRDDFEAGRVDIAGPIAEILSANPEIAYTGHEVRDRLQSLFGRSASLGEVAVALNRLVEDGVVEARDIGLERRYAIVLSGEQ